MSLENLEPIVSLAKRRGFIFQSSEIYGGLSSCYDYGPLGVELKNNVKRAWWKAMVQERNDVVGLDAAILMHPKTWEASGHIAGFTDPLVDCKDCKKRWRADHLLEAKGIKPDFRPCEWDKHNVVCPDCGGDLTDVRKFNLMFKTFMGALEDNTSQIYLRPETCQGIYVNFLNVQQSMRKKIPFGVAQIGKAFRNEITPGNFTFRTREFEQMEQQYFIHPDQKKEVFEMWKKARMQWYLDFGMKKENLQFRQHKSDELAHYAAEAWDIEYNYPGMGFKELAGIHDRGNWDLSRHSEYSGQDLSYFDQEKNEKFIPHIVETSDGADRATLAFLIDAYEEIDARSGSDDAKHEKEYVLRLHKDLAPIKIAILPLSKKEPLQNLSNEIQNSLRGTWMTQHDETGSIGKRYRRQDEIGTPYCVTVDFDSLEDKKVTVRDRDTMEQERVDIGELKDYFNSKFYN
ncbi:MAG: glycine--tRNA ligase [Candidatus Magasanikbacteria bacterium CG_4_10_14_0_2_um_filter_37_12]|uniref:Glycine--tRNA ligase n=1 Tax=Candidatus Magasanikbacteria bacterium CG_4_10_14_0_2_um_filter_37_12 TaxID=1974637 RepID=A0A2M7V8A5_9BACT|nr:MAG: glycine--tRNA ligase [Candidatus Magasanikbacteria bacterium CG_4_10_14_0_2_um_filter_37_12]